MLSSTSSSEVPFRPVPERNWPRIFAAALVAALVLLAAWEWWARARGYAKHFADTAAHWARERRKVEPDSLVAIGSSRILFDLDLEVVAEAFGRKPIQLGRVGTSPRPMLSDLARDRDFRGTVLCGVTPSLFFAPGGPPVDRGNAFVKDWRREPLSTRSGQLLGMFLEARLALRNEDLALRQLLHAVPLPVRSGAIPFPPEVPYFGETREDRSIRMIPRMERDFLFQDEVRDVWRQIMASIPVPPPEVALAGRDAVVAAVAADVKTIRERGGKVIFLCFPSTGAFLEYERKNQPRTGYWDRLLAETGAPGIHFEDHPSLSGFDCPEWSHLTSADATRYTQALVPLLAPLLGAR